ncbi:tRNA threonylcarbamoyladenosine biosynthesis protein [Clostridiales bacterium PH28_bin88]|nr:tRNA threonylcarbamoyladenosine biosynthesis protein [Clostridiales bacterium PH28_bin88]
MDTLYLKVDSHHPEEGPVRQAARILKEGGLVAFPTETVYGLGANALDPQAVARIFHAKGRPADNPLIVHVASPAEVEDLVVSVPPKGERLMRHFWPGPLTLVLPRKPVVPDVVTAGLDTVAVRMPDHPVALALIRAAGVPVAAPSANLSGRPSPTTARHVLQDLGGMIDAIVDGGRSSVGVESTVLDLTTPSPMVLRPGGVTLEQLSDLLGEKVELDPAIAAEADPNLAPRAPGMKYTHYSPRAEVVIVAGEVAAVREKIIQLVAEYQAAEKRVAVLASQETLGFYLGSPHQPEHLAVLGVRADLSSVASHLYGALRSCDEAGADVALVEAFPSQGLGLAVMNRLYKAAGYRIIEAT